VYTLTLLLQATHSTHCTIIASFAIQSLSNWLIWPAIQVNPSVSHNFYRDLWWICLESSFSPLSRGAKKALTTALYSVWLGGKDHSGSSKGGEEENKTERREERYNDCWIATSSSDILQQYYGETSDESMKTFWWIKTNKLSLLQSNTDNLHRDSEQKLVNFTSLITITHILIKQTNNLKWQIHI
jgi:hypothetical protein